MISGSQEQSLRIEQVEMLWGLETGGFRLCYYRRVTVKANQQAVNSPALVNCAEFVLDKQIITVTCGADYAPRVSKPIYPVSAGIRVL